MNNKRGSRTLLFGLDIEGMITKKKELSPAKRNKILNKVGGGMVTTKKTRKKVQKRTTKRPAKRKNNKSRSINIRIR